VVEMREELDTVARTIPPVALPAASDDIRVSPEDMQVLNEEAADRCDPSDGRWIADIAHFIGNATWECDPDANGCACGPVRAAKWTPNKKECRLDYDPTSICSNLANETIVMVGDSTMYQTSFVYNQALGPYGCKSIYVESDTLVDMSCGVMNRGDHWFKAIEQHKPTVLVLSVGPHIKKAVCNYHTILQEIASRIQAVERMKNITVLWKTSNPPGGCENCQAKIRESTTLRTDMMNEWTEEALTWSAEGYGVEEARHWAWDTITHQDDVARGIFGRNVIDMKPLWYRSDAHPCSHFSSIQEANQKSSAQLTHLDEEDMQLDGEADGNAKWENHHLFATGEHEADGNEEEEEEDDNDDAKGGNRHLFGTRENKDNMAHELATTSGEHDCLHYCTGANSALTLFGSLLSGKVIELRKR